MKVCTLAVGEKYTNYADSLKLQMPADIAIYRDLPKNITHYNNFFNYNCKKYAIKNEYDDAGTLFVDADSKCVSPTDFENFVKNSRSFEPGIYSPYIFSAYGFRHTIITEQTINREKLTVKLKIYDKILHLTDSQLLKFSMPYEWLMFFKFVDECQKDAFFDRWDFLEKILLESAFNNLQQECNLIGLAAQFCNLPIVKLNIKSGFSHK